jgi:Prephenate dehydratase
MVDILPWKQDDDTPPGKVAYQGAAGAFSHEACVDLRPWDEAVAYETFAEAIQAVVDGDVGCALIPVENSIVGRVEPAATLVEGSGLVVVKAVWRPIRLALMGLPEAQFAHVRTVESHPVALKQAAKAIKALGLKVVEAFDTAGAARSVAEGGDVTRAALAPSRAAEAYGLSIFSNDLQDSEDNRTCFVLLARKDD